VYAHIILIACLIAEAGELRRSAQEEGAGQPEPSTLNPQPKTLYPKP